MRLLISLLLASSLLPAQKFGYAGITQDVGPWGEILSSIGLLAQPVPEASIYIGRAGTAVDKSWAQRVEGGAFLILEGDSPLARSLGFRLLDRTTRVASVIDVHRPDIPLILEHAVELSETAVPETARIFARERWTNAPVIAGFRQGKGAVLWVATSPGKHGYERFPYIVNALLDLGFEPPFRSNRLWAFFDYSYRTRVDVNWFAKRWHQSGIAALQVAAWHFYESDPERDRYLNALIEACHREGVLVYAWLELPHVSERFWADHPEWREKTALQQDAQLDWRKLMNLANPECAKAIHQGTRELMRRFDWDGVNFAELYYESLEGADNPARFTPLNKRCTAALPGRTGWVRSGGTLVQPQRRGFAPKISGFSRRACSIPARRMAKRGGKLPKLRPATGYRSHPCRRPSRSQNARRHWRGHLPAECSFD